VISKMRILIVDNQSRARHSMKALLGAWYPSAEVREAADGFEAVRLSEEFQPDVILMDARMPRMSGLEAVRHIKAKSPTIKIVVLSMYSDMQSKAIEAGADAFVGKGDLPEKIRETLQYMLSPVEPK
jgi:CheY-like chemotaxis protein